MSDLAMSNIEALANNEMIFLAPDGEIILDYLYNFDNLPHKLSIRIKSSVT